MAYVKADVVQAVLYDLGQIGDDGVVETTDSTRVGVRFDALVGLLTQRDIVTINPASIPEYHFEGLKRYLVIECAAMVAGKALDIEALAEALTTIRHVARENVSISGNAEHVIQEALQNLGALKPGGGPTLRDKGFLSGLLDDTLSDLSQRDIISIANQAAIGTNHTRPLIQILTQVAGPKFGKPHDQAAVETAEAALYEIARANYTVSSVADKVIQDVLQLVGRVPVHGAPSTRDRLTVSNLLDNLLADLSQRDVITIANQAAVTTTHANPLIEILAQLAGPKFGKPYNGELVGAAEARLFKIARASNTTSTVAEKVIYEVLSNVGAVKPGEVPSTRDKTYISQLFDNLLADLAREDIITIANQAAVVALGSNALILALTQLAGPKFGKAASLDAITSAKEQLRAIDRMGRTVASTDSAQLVATVLRALKVIKETEGPSTKEAAAISDRLDGILADLSARRIAYIDGVTDLSAPGLFEALADYITALLSRGYPQSGIGAGDRLTLMRDAEVRLKRMGQPVQIRNLRVDAALLPSRRSWNFSTGQ